MNYPFKPEVQLEKTLKLSSYVSKREGLENTPLLNVLTSTEQKVVNYVACGMTNREIAQEMNVSQRTIETCVSNMLAKIGFRDLRRNK